MLRDREVWGAAVHEVAESDMTGGQNNNKVNQQTEQLGRCFRYLPRLRKKEKAEGM